MSDASTTAEAAIRPRWQYWPEIDGLRTIAVLSVFVFHLSRPWLPGGFVGVDIFFVISGYLIGSILLDDLAERRFSIAKFYQRRIARIFPALILVIGVTFAAASLISARHDLASTAVNAAYAAISLINMRLITQDSYFAITPDSQPLLHYWSLAVEEQFYVVFPLFLYLIVRFTKRPLAIMLGCAAISFALCVFLTRSHPTMAFYVLPSRAWELLAGAALALYRSEGGRLAERFRSGAGWIGAALIAVSIALIDEKNGFPGWIAALPVLGTVLILAPIGENRPWLQAQLARPWVVAIGKRSYSLYLWHWPVFCLVDYQLLMWNDLSRIALKVVLSVVLTLLSYRFVEQPARRFLNDPKRFKLAVIGAVVLAATVAIVGFQVRDRNLFEAMPATYAAGGWTVANPGDRGTVVLVGDSQATMYGPTLAEMAREQHFTLHMLAESGENFLPGAERTHWDAVAAYIRDHKPDVVVMANFWSTKLTDAAPLRTALGDLGTNAPKVILLTQPPFLEDGFGRATIRSGRRPPFAEPAALAHQRLAANALLHGFESPQVSVLDFTRELSAPDGSVAVFAPDGTLAYFDSSHLTDSGIVRVRPALTEALRKALPPRP
jgi:peptidoglycan/LPS O-acetylase OafA/YrhL